MTKQMISDLKLATYVGIDVHPGTHTACAINRFEEEKGHLCFDNTEKGIKQFLLWLPLIEPVTDNLLIGVEGRGGNGHALISYLLNSGYTRVYEVNSLYTKHKRTLGTRQDKTDVRDARLIAEVVIRKVLELPLITKQEYIPIRIQLKKSVEFYDEVTHQGTRLKNQLCRLRRELRLATSPEEQLTLSFIVKEKETDLSRIVKRQKDLVLKFKALIEKNGKNLTTIKGIKTTAAAQIMAYINSIDRFHTVDSFILYAGIAPVERSSGKTVRFKQNHGGNRQLNCVLHMAAITNMTWDPKGKEYYEKKLKEGKTKKHAIRCLMERLASIIYGMLKNGKDYQNDYRKENKKDTLE
jgi:transposase